MWFFHIECYSSVLKKKKEILIHASTWINLGNIVPSERSSDERPHIRRIRLYETSHIGSSVEAEIEWLPRAKVLVGSIESDC